MKMDILSPKKAVVAMANRNAIAYQVAKRPGTMTVILDSYVNGDSSVK